MFVAPIKDAAGAVKVLTRAFADVVDYLVMAGVVKRTEGPKETGVSAMIKIAQNDAELKKFDDLEKGGFQLSTEQGYRKSELLEQNVALMQGAAKGTGLERGYADYLAAIDMANKQPAMAALGMGPIKAMDMGQYMRQTNEFRGAALAQNVLPNDERLDGYYGRQTEKASGALTALTALGGPTGGLINSAATVGGALLDMGNGKGFAGERNAGEGVAAIIAAAKAQQEAANKMSSAADKMAAIGPPGQGAP